MGGNLSRSNDLGIGQGRFFKAATALCMAFLLVPLAVLVVYSFNASKQVTVWGGFSFKWFVATVQDRELWMALRNSFLIASVNALLSTALGTMAALALGRYAFRGRRLYANLLYLPVVLPEIILGIALLTVFVSIGVPRGFFTVICGHVAFSFPFVSLLVLARVQALDRSQEEASLDLGASPWRTFHRVLLPPLAPAMLSGLLFAFAMSLDDFVITFFTTSPEVLTLPLKVYSMVKFGLSPVINVISTLQIVFTLVVLMAVNWLQQGGQRQRWGMRLGGAVTAALVALLVLSIVSERRQSNLVLGIWSEYIDPVLLDDFEAQTGIHVIRTYFSDGEEILTKVSMGKPGIDLIVPAGYMVEAMRKRDLLAPLDFSRIPNARFIDERFRHLAYDPSGLFSIPYTYGLTGIAYNSAKISEPIDSWEALWDPRYRGKILMLDDMLECFSVAHRILGFDIAGGNVSHLDDALDLLLKQNPFLRKYESNLINDMLANGEAVIAPAWNGEVLKLAIHHPEFKFIIPREGTLLFVDNLALLKSAPHPESAHLFLDFLLDPQHTARNMQCIRYAMPNPEAVQLLPADMRENTTLFPPLGDMSRFSIMPDLGSFLVEIQKRWVRLKNQ